ncbi:hypothetical protein E3A20_05990 [Planctomyces bekefii]|uniref:Uncharacterized protein n=1 Tax=Planctomyces bekefii TaxID=1653850 RepID=A0A5C6M7W7_9PLAN|nr:hypothetical protein E3A20_05990 [Planctomyces bekefii]
MFPGLRLVVELGDYVGLPDHIKDRPLAAGGKGYCGQADLVAQMVTQ